MFKKKEQEDELHHEYGVLSNACWMFGKIRKYRPVLLIYMIVGAVTGSAAQYIWSFIGKFVIDIVEKSAVSGGDIAPLIHLVAVAAIVEILCLGFNTYTGQLRNYSCIFVRMKLISERTSKALYMNYESLENPKMLDRQEKAIEATDNNDNGCEGMIRGIFSIMQQLVVIAVTLATLSILDIRLVGVIIVFSVIQYVFFLYTIKKSKKNVWDAMAPTWRKIYYMQQTTQDFSYAKDIRIFGMKNWLIKKQSEVNAEKLRCLTLDKNYWSYNSIFVHSVSILRNVITYGFLIYSVIFKDLSIGNFTLFLGIAGTFSATLTELLNGWGHFQECSMKVDDFRSFLDIPTEEEDTVPVPRGCDYTFTFENVSFKYSGQDSYAVKNLNLTFEQGKRLAIVGLNGAGKTTFIKLLLCLYDVTDGRILLNGTDVRKFDRREYYELFAPVFQNVEIFAFPMAENVSMRSPSDTDREKSDTCLRMAGMGDKLDELADGVNTQLLKVIYEDGVDLSGGQKQKLALARALYKDAPIVVLDEPTAAMDALAEYKMYTDFDKITEGKSAIYISHRLSSTRFCDSIAMFKNGEMVEYGTHEELLKKGGEYAEMFEVQAQYYRNGKEAQQVG